ncbi:MAG: hypothetical protein NTZ13_00020 [Candidatus Parcubacteria bacterium]|nr:hypothetical protein [Candidatus Parcubacteria bacterium]
MNKKLFAITIIAIMSLFGSISVLAIPYTPPTAVPVISIGTTGATTMRGTLKTAISNADTAFTITSWAKDYTIDFSVLKKGSIAIDGYTQVAGDTVISLLQKFNAGDMIGLTGTMNSSGVVKTNYVHDWTIEKTATLDSVIIDGVMTGIVKNASNQPNGFTLTGSVVAIGNTVVSNSPVKTYTVSVVNCALTDSGCIPTLFMDYERNTKSTYSALWAENDKVRIQANLLTGTTDPRALVVRNLNIKGGVHTP